MENRGQVCVEINNQFEFWPELDRMPVNLARDNDVAASELLHGAFS